MKELNKSSFTLINVLLSCFVFIMLYVNSSYNVAILSGITTLGVSLVCGIIIIILSKRDKISQYLLLWVIALSLNIIISSIFAEDPVKDLFIMISVIWISMLFVIGLEFKKYCEIFTNIMLVISVYSLIVYILSIIAPSIIRLFPTAYFRPGFETYNLGLTFINIEPELIRNMGIFWEPGTFQTYLVIAIIVEIFVLKTRNFALTAFFLSLITTWSTAAFINVLFLLIIFVIFKNEKSKTKFVKVIISIAILIIIITFTYSILPYEIQYAMFGKIAVYLSSESNNTITSASVRFDSIVYPLSAFLTSPILGVGYSGLKESILSAGHTMTTNTPSNWFAAYGLFFGVVCTVSLFKLSNKLNKNSILSILIFIAFMLSISTENYLRNVSIMIFLLYGLKKSLRLRR